MLIRVWRSGVPFLSPTYQIVGHECTVDEAAPPKYLLPWTPHCVKCRGEVLQQYGRIRYTEESVTRQPIALISMRCHRCLALYGYDTVTVGEGEDEEVYRLSLPRDHIVLARNVFGRPYVHELQQRIVLQFASFQAEGGVKEVPRTKLQEVVFLDWCMRYYREARGQSLFRCPDLHTVVSEVTGFLRLNGLPSKHHQCSACEPAHLNHIRGMPTVRPDIKRHTAEVYDRCVVVDCISKVCRRVCMYGIRQNKRDPSTGLHVQAQCSKAPVPGTCFCKEHSTPGHVVYTQVLEGDVGSDVMEALPEASSGDHEHETTDAYSTAQEEETVVSRSPQPTLDTEYTSMLHEIALSHATGATCTPSTTTTQQSRQQPPHTAAGQGRGKGGHQGAKQKMRRKTVWSVSGQGCKKKVVVFTGFTNGLMTVSRPCTVVVHFDEMVVAEGSHQILYNLWSISTRHRTGGISFDWILFDYACRLSQTSAKYNVLSDVQCVLDRFHGTVHKCQGYGMSQFPELSRVNSSAAEQGNSTTGRYRFAANPRDADTFYFYIANCLEGRNRYIIGGHKASAITALGGLQPVEGVHDDEDPTSWVVDVAPLAGSGQFCTFVARLAKLYHLQATWAADPSYVPFNPFSAFAHRDSVRNVPALNPHTHGSARSTSSTVARTPAASAASTVCTTATFGSPAVTTSSATAPSAAPVVNPTSVPMETISVSSDDDILTAPVQDPAVLGVVKTEPGDNVPPSLGTGASADVPQDPFSTAQDVSTSPLVDPYARSPRLSPHASLDDISFGENDASIAAMEDTDPEVLRHFKIEPDVNVPPSLHTLSSARVMRKPFFTDRRTSASPSAHPYARSPASSPHVSPSRFDISPDDPSTGNASDGAPRVVRARGKKAKVYKSSSSRPGTVVQAAAGPDAISFVHNYTLLGDVDRGHFTRTQQPIPLQSGVWDYAAEPEAFQALLAPPFGMQEVHSKPNMLQLLQKVKGKQLFSVRRLWSTLFANRKHPPSMSQFKAMLVHLHQAHLVLLVIVGARARSCACLMLPAPCPAPAILVQNNITVDEWDARCSADCLYSVAFDQSSVPKPPPRRRR